MRHMIVIMIQRRTSAVEHSSYTREYVLYVKDTKNIVLFRFLPISIFLQPVLCLMQSLCWPVYPIFLWTGLAGISMLDQ